MGLLSIIIAGAELGATIGGAVATVTGVAAETAVAVGTIAGAGVGAVVGVTEAENAKEAVGSYC